VKVGESQQVRLIGALVDSSMDGPLSPIPAVRSCYRQTSISNYCNQTYSSGFAENNGRDISFVQIISSNNAIITPSIKDQGIFNIAYTQTTRTKANITSTIALKVNCIIANLSGIMQPGES
jgi:hypothetical protein